MIDFTTTTISELHKKLKAGELSPRDLFDRAQEKIKERDGEIHAFIETFDFEVPEASDSFLAGIPMGMKDNILIKGKSATAASDILRGYIASYDASVSEILKESGASFAGCLNMDDAAMGSSTETSCYGPTKNPRDLTRVPGGSSGGPAAAVAAGMVPYALGSDTGGSIRQPAAFCGVVGMKPTYGAVSRRGLIAMASSLDVIGPFTNNVADARIVFNEIARHDPLDATSVPQELRAPYQEKGNQNNKTIGVPRAFVESEGVDPVVLETFNASLEKLKEQGYTVVDIDLPLLKYALAVYYIIQPAEASSNLARFDGIRYGLKEEGKDLIDDYFKTKTKGFGKEVKRRIMLGTHVLSSGYHDAYYHKALALREALTKEVQAIFDTVDVIATPTAPSGAFKFGEKADPVQMYLQDIFTVPYNLTGNPAISVPMGQDENKMPLGIHFAAPLFCEEKLFEVAEDFEKTQDR